MTLHTRTTKHKTPVELRFDRDGNELSLGEVKRRLYPQLRKTRALSTPGRISCLCKAHDDYAPSFGVMEDSGRLYVCCFAGCRPAKICETVGLFPPPRGWKNRAKYPGVSLEDYAAVVGVPAANLRMLGCRTFAFNWHSETVTGIPYYNEKGELIALRYRHDPTVSGLRFTWRMGDTRKRGQALYGLWNLHVIRRLGYTFIVEGESDVHNLLYAGVCAVGVPGAVGFWTPKHAELFKSTEVVIVQGRDAAGAIFAHSVSDSLPSARIVQPPPGCKDVSDIALSGGDLAAWASKALRNSQHA